MFKTEFPPVVQVLFMVGALVVAIVLIDSVHSRRVLHKSDRLTILCIAYADGACDQVKIRIQKEAGNEEGR